MSDFSLTLESLVLFSDNLEILRILFFEFAKDFGFLFHVFEDLLKLLILFYDQVVLGLKTDELTQILVFLLELL